jgi:hypothetical protein
LCTDSGGTTKREKDTKQLLFHHGLRIKNSFYLLAKIRKKSETANLRDENTEIKKNGLKGQQPPAQGNALGFYV